MIIQKHAVKASFVLRQVTKEGLTASKIDPYNWSLPPYNLHLAKYDNCCTLTSILKLSFQCLSTIYIYVLSM